MLFTSKVQHRRGRDIGLSSDQQGDNDNKACVKWCHNLNLTTKGNCHMEHWEKVTREWVEDGSISVSHVNGKCNPSNIFTKEMRDSANFHRLWGGHRRRRCRCARVPRGGGRWITQHALLYNFHTSNVIFEEIFFLKFLSLQPLFQKGLCKFEGRGI